MGGMCGDYGAHTWRSSVRWIEGDRGGWMDDDGGHEAGQTSG